MLFENGRNAMARVTRLGGFDHPHERAFIFGIMRVAQRTWLERAHRRRKFVESGKLEHAKLEFAHRQALFFKHDAVDEQIIMPRIKRVRRDQHRHAVIDCGHAHAMADRLADLVLCGQRRIGSGIVARKARGEFFAFLLHCNISYPSYFGDAIGFAADLPHFRTISEDFGRNWRKFRQNRALALSYWRKFRDGAAMRKGPRPLHQSGNRPRFWGRHAVIAALANPDRVVRRLWATREAIAGLDIPKDLPVVLANVADLGKMVPPDAPHQGLVAEIDPLDDIWLQDVLIAGKDDHRPIIVLDQVTDPHNVGAILRSAAAFDALALVTQDRHSPPESGTVARAACGALELVPWVRVVNLARALDEISEAGYWRIGLEGDTDRTLSDAIGTARVALILGAEGEGMRHNTRVHCDELARLPISPQMESLNVSNAAAIALYATAQAREPQS